MTARRDHWQPSWALVGVVGCAVLVATTACSAASSGANPISPAPKTGPTAEPGTRISAGPSPQPTLAPLSSAPTAKSTPAPAITSSITPSTAPPPAAVVPAGWVDQDISFQSDGLTIHGTFRHLSDSSTALPGVLLIAGSGPTDRNGNSSLVPGSMNTLANLAGVLAGDDVASLRYDKLGSGATGLGEFAAHLDTIGVDVSPGSRRPRFGSYPNKPVWTGPGCRSTDTAKAHCSRCCWPLTPTSPRCRCTRWPCWNR